MHSALLDEPISSIIFRTESGRNAGKQKPVKHMAFDDSPAPKFQYCETEMME